MRWVARTGIRLEHAVPEHILSGHGPVGLNLRFWNVRVGQRRRRKLALSEAVHRAIIHVLYPAQVAVIEIAAIAERNRLERDFYPVAQAGLRRIRTGKAVEQVIEGAVFLHDDHNVIDGRAGNGRDPVSYTHLDVYKRQELHQAEA